MFFKKWKVVLILKFIRDWQIFEPEFLLVSFHTSFSKGRIYTIRGLLVVLSFIWHEVYHFGSANSITISMIYPDHKERLVIFIRSIEMDLYMWDAFNPANIHLPYVIQIKELLKIFMTFYPRFLKVVIFPFHRLGDKDFILKIWDSIDSIFEKIVFKKPLS